VIPLAPRPAESGIDSLPPGLQPCRWQRRFAAFLIDLVLLGAALALIGHTLPVSPPPTQAMAFYGRQDFVNYFTLVVWALVLTSLAFAAAACTVSGATPGQRLLGLRLVSLKGGGRVTTKVWAARWAAAMVRMLLITVPGPVIALIVGLIAGAVLSLPFQTTDAMLRAAAMPPAARWALHGLSFAALLVALWRLAVGPFIAWLERQEAGLTMLDRATNSTYVVGVP
jgi:uncharacterized RDD family membrane protein YckC